METTHKIYVSNISYDANERQFRQFFQRFGKIIDCRLPMDGRKVLGYGFVEFSTEEEMNKAIASNGIEFLNRPMRIEKSQPKKQRQNNSKEENETNEMKETPQPIKLALNAQKFVRSNKPHEEIAIKEEESDEEEEEKSETTIFVRNLPFSVNDARFRELFAKYDVVDCHVVSYRDRTKVKSKGYGFVTLANNEKQVLAINEMNNAMVEGRQISVSVAYKWQEKRN